MAPADFNTYGSRRGNHEVMMRGTFANVKLQNMLAAGEEGRLDARLPDGRACGRCSTRPWTIEAAGVPLVVVAGKMYGSGSSRDWAAKGPALLGVRAAFAESFERIHRSNLIGMGVLPLQLPEGRERRRALGLDGTESLRRSRPIELRGRGASRAARGGRDGRARSTVACGGVRGDRCASTRRPRPCTCAMAGSCSTWSAKWQVSRNATPGARYVARIRGTLKEGGPPRVAGKPRLTWM